MTQTNAQNILYYQLVSCSDESAFKNGGQFITFVGNICFESNAEGISVNNGKLTRNQYRTNNNQIVYDGGAFIGGNATFVFNSDKSHLEVTDNNGLTYAFDRTTPPINVKTSSFIRQRDDGGTISNYASFGSTGSHYNPGTTNNRMNNTSTQKKAGNVGNDHKHNTTTYQKDCHSCHGTGSCKTCNGEHRYINPFTGKYVTCPNCRPDGVCSVCGGTGKKR